MVAKVAAAPPPGTISSSAVDVGPKLTWGYALLMNLTFSTSGAVVTFPYTFGVLGVALSVILLLAWMAIALYANLAVVDAAIKCKAKTLGDVGEAMGGKFGRVAAEVGQIGNLAFFIPVALQLCGGTMQWLVSESNASKCLGLWTIIVWAVLVVLLQGIRSLDHGKWMTVLSILLLAIKCFVLLPYVFASEDNPLGPREAASAFGNPAVPASTWSDIAGALSSIPYGVCPIFILVEVMAEMKEPEKMKKALWLAFGGMLLFYLVPAYTAVGMWGHYVNDPITAGVGHTGASIAANLFVLFATFNDAFLGAATMFKFGRLRLMPTLVEDDFSPRGMARWLFLTGPYFLCALVVATCIPNFMMLVGFLTSLTVVLPNSALPAGLIIAKRRKAREPGTALLVPAVVGLIGLGASSFMLAGTIDDISDLTFGHFEALFCAT